MFAIGNDELEQKPPLGKTILCPQCNKRHRVLYGKKKENGVWVQSKDVAFYKCGDKEYLAGLYGKRVC